LVLRSQLAYRRRVCGPGDKVRHRDLAHKESPKARLSKNQWTRHRESTLRERERPEKTIGSLTPSWCRGQQTATLIKAQRVGAYARQACHFTGVKRSSCGSVCSHIGSVKAGTCSRVKRNSRPFNSLHTRSCRTAYYDSRVGIVDYAHSYSIRHHLELHFDLARRLEARNNMKEYRLYLAEAPSGAHSLDGRNQLRVLSTR
jgi:hypothetical protein